MGPIVVIHGIGQAAEVGLNKGILWVCKSNFIKLV